MRVARLFLFAGLARFSGQSEGENSNASGTGSVRVSAQGLSRSCCKLSPMKIPSSRLAAPASPRIACVVSVSVRFSARSRHFSFFYALFCARPNFRAAKRRKMPRTCEKPYGNACYAGYSEDGIALVIHLPTSPAPRQKVALRAKETGKISLVASSRCKT